MIRDSASDAANGQVGAGARSLYTRRALYSSCNRSGPGWIHGISARPSTRDAPSASLAQSQRIFKTSINRYYRLVIPFDSGIMLLKLLHNTIKDLYIMQFDSTSRRNSRDRSVAPHGEREAAQLLLALPTAADGLRARDERARQVHVVDRREPGAVEPQVGVGKRER